MQNANQVNVTGGTYNGQTVEEALDNVSSDVTNISTQVTQIGNDVAADNDGDSTNELQDADEVNFTGGIYNGQNVQQVIENLETEITADGDGDSTNELQNANQVNVTGGTYNGQTVEEALDNVSGDVANLSAQAAQNSNDIAADEDGDSTNELQNANQVDVTGGTYNGQDVQAALELIATALAADNDGDASNELQNANQVNVTGGTYNGQTVQQALEVLTNAVAAGDNDSDPSNELQAAIDVPVTGGAYTGMSVQQALQIIAVSLQADDDGDATNELQDADEVNITSGTYAGSNVQSALENVAAAQAADDDGDSTNELQELIYDGETIGITNGNTIDLQDILLGAPGASIRYPQGIIGDYIVVTSANYQVPAGKTFYMTGGPPTVDLLISGTTFTHPTAPNMPILSSGQIIQDCKCIGLLIDEADILEVVMVNFQQSPTYTVPAGKELIVKSGMVNDDVSFLVVNGTQIEFFRPNFLRASSLLAFPEGTELQMPNNVSQMILTAYLIDLEP